jgi:hypothetical protein
MRPHTSHQKIYRGRGKGDIGVTKEKIGVRQSKHRSSERKGFLNARCGSFSAHMETSNGVGDIQIKTRTSDSGNESARSNSCGELTPEDGPTHANAFIWESLLLRCS